MRGFLIALVLSLLLVLVSAADGGADPKNWNNGVLPVLGVAGVVAFNEFQKRKHNLKIHGVYLPKTLVKPSDKTYNDSDRGEFTRGGERYFCPIGWTRYPLQNVDQECLNWPIAYHGTKSQHLKSILTVGLKKPGERGTDGVVKIPKGHIPAGFYKEPDGADFTDHVFVTPSIHYAKFYAMPGKSEEYMFVLQVRVRPHSYKKGAETVDFRKRLPLLRKFMFWNPALISKEGFSNEELEWMVRSSNDVKVTALLVKKVEETDRLHLQEQGWF